MSAVIDDVPMVARAAPASLDMFGQSSMQGVIRTSLLEDGIGDLWEELIIDPADGAADGRVRRRRIHLESPIPLGEPNRPELVSSHVSILCPADSSF